MISFIGNRPAIQIGRHQVIDYGTEWLDAALLRAARAADLGDFAFVEEIRAGVVQYLETKCPLRLLALEELFDRMRRMLVQIGCVAMAEKLEPLAPPVTVSLIRAAMDAGNGFELAFFVSLRAELRDLKVAGAEEIRFTGLRESTMILRGVAKWDRRCDALLVEIQQFLRAWDRDQGDGGQPLQLRLEAGF